MGTTVRIEVLGRRGRREMTAELIALMAEASALPVEDRARFLAVANEMTRGHARRIAEVDPFALSDARAELMEVNGL